MTLYRSIILLLFSLLAVLPAIKAQTSEVNKSTVSVMEYGAKADGKNDDTGAFQKALDAKKDKGGIVNVPSGTYLIAGSLVVPEGVTLLGEWEAPHNTALGKGSVIYATGSAGNENGTPLINLTQNSCLKGLTIFYPEQDINNVKPYPWTIQGNGTNCSVINVTLTNPYKAIDFGTFSNELHYVSNVYGQPLKIGIFVDKCGDIGRIENVHFNPNAWTRCGYPGYPKEGTPAWDKLVKYLNENLEGFVFVRTDWEYVTNSFVIFPKIGFHFTSRDDEKGNVLITQSGADITRLAVQVDATQKHAGVEFNNCQFMGTVNIKPTNEGPIKFSNCGFWSIDSTNSQVTIEGTGTVTLTGTHFSRWAEKDKTAPCINLISGSMIVNACDFRVDGKRQIQLGAGTTSAAIYGCRFVGGEKITNNAPSSAKIQIGLNIE
jgi:hypothetical protein